jgi:outer membrane protein assembly factor BamB
VLDAKTGKELWKQWLGDPLMSQPAISKGKLFMAYPSGQKGRGEGGHALLCADLHTGKHLWTTQISSDVISAPIVEYDRVYVACMDGASYSFSTKDGSLIWKKQGAATSAPVVHDGKMIMAERSGQGKSVNEGMRRIDSKSGLAKDKELLAYAPAPYIWGATNGTIGPQGGDAKVLAGYNMEGKAVKPSASPLAAKKQWYQSMDSSVGFASAPASADLARAESNLGISSVSGAWGYQGARATFRDGAVTNTQLTYVNCVDAETGKVKWRAQAQAPFITGQSQVFSTPALGHQNMYLCSGDGHLVCMDQKTGAVKYMYATNKPISFQPALAGGNIYIGTANGQLICIAAGDADADGWTAWGGNAQHNKTE